MEPFLGQIQPTAFNFAPRGWALCDGQILAISQNTALFSLLGTTFGGDGRTTFGLPDLRGRAIVGVGQGPGISSPITWGEKTGANSTTLIANNLASHVHAVTVTPGSTERGSTTSSDANGNYLGNLTDMYRTGSAGTGSLNGAASTNTGGNQPLNIQNPIIGIYVSIALVGIYPSRN